MKIKEIKSEWINKPCTWCNSAKRMFAVHSFNDIGKCVIVVVNDPYLGKTVDAVIPVKTGKDILNGHSRPCDNMVDAIDVAGEMINDNWDDLNI
jgi:hypothetical protein